MNYIQNDIGYGLGVANLGFVDTAASASAATILTTQGINTTGVDSVKFIIGSTATLASGATLSVSATYAESDDDNTYDTAVAILTNAVIATGASGGSTEYAASSIDLDTMGTKKYVRLVVTPDFSATSTDVATIAAVAAYAKKYND